MQQLDDSDPKLVGPYRVIARLGAGGMGRVYLCSSPGGRRLAVKVIHPELANDADFRERFRREVAAARLVLSHVTAAVIDADTESQSPWLATIYLEGPTLQAKVEQCPLVEPELRGLAAALAEALQFIHDAGLVHRDLKPSNIILAPDGPRVIDFGIARATDATALTTANLRIGSPGYMAPEQISANHIGPECDIFALGAVLAFAATAKAAFGTGEPVAVAYRVLHGTPNLDGVPPSLRAIVAECLAKDPKRRPTPGQILRETTGSPVTLALVAQPLRGEAAALEIGRAQTWSLGVRATKIDTQAASPPEDVSAWSTKRPAPRHQGFREAERRVSTMENATQLDLARLDLCDSDLRTLWPDIRSLMALTELSLSGNHLNLVPESIGNLTALTGLWLNHNQLSAVPESIGNLTGLAKLNLEYNQLSAVPESIGNLTALTELLLSANQLTVLPESLSNLTALKTLTLFDNRLNALPESIGNLTALTFLALSGNRLSALPESLGNLTALIALLVDGNRLNALPESIGNLTALIKLQLQRNQLSALPESISNLSALTQLFVDQQLTAQFERFTWQLSAEESARGVCPTCLKEKRLTSHRQLVASHVFGGEKCQGSGAEPKRVTKPADSPSGPMKPKKSGASRGKVKRTASLTDRLP